MFKVYVSNLFTQQVSNFIHVLSVFRLQHQVKKHNLIVASYDVVRNDIDFFR